jgi:hypothetical protein
MLNVFEHVRSLCQVPSVILSTNRRCTSIPYGSFLNDDQGHRLL